MDCDHWRAGKVAEFLARGTPVLVEGELDQQSWEKDGQKRSKIVLQVQHLQLVGRKDREPEEELATDFA
jgi:single-stranded DNA-binding protein